MGTRYQLAIQRTGGFLSSYTLNMLYGAAIIALRKSRREYRPVYLVRSGEALCKVPKWVIALTRPANRYMPGVFAEHGPMPRAPWRRRAWLEAHPTRSPGAKAGQE